MSRLVTRRGFLAGVGGGIASAALVWGLGRSSYWTAGTPGARAAAGCCGVLVHSGWLLTPTDRERLTARGQMTILEGTSFQGGDIANDLVDNVEACEAWCASNLDCRSFTYAGPNHPQEDMRNRCWIKRTSDLPRTEDRVHTSGIR